MESRGGHPNIPDFARTPEFRALVDRAMLRDADRVMHAIRARGHRSPKTPTGGTGRRARGRGAGMSREEAERILRASVERAAARARSVPPIAYPEELPVSQRREEIKAAIAAHQVVVI